MLAPLRRGKKETLGRADGITRTGRSLLFGVVLVVLVTASGLLYTSERLVVEQMLRDNLDRENTLQLIQKRTENLAYDVASLASIKRIRGALAQDSSMVALDWKDVVVVDGRPGDR
jgi:hypothetical protein